MSMLPSAFLIQPSKYGTTSWPLAHFVWGIAVGSCWVSSAEDFTAEDAEDAERNPYTRISPIASNTNATASALPAYRSLVVFLRASTRCW